MFDSHNPFAIIFVLGITLILTFGAWFISATFSSTAFIEKQIESSKLNKTLWATAQLQNYSYSIWYGCMYSDTSNVVVTGGVERFKENYKGVTIKHLFKVLPEIFAKASSFKIDYNKNYGFPQHIKVDWNADVYDDECFYDVQDFIALD